jgi:hypothetical protein
MFLQSNLNRNAWNREVSTKYKRIFVFAFGCVALLGFAGHAAAQDYDIGVYYQYYEPGDSSNLDNYGYDWALMDLARNGCMKLFVSGNCLDSIFWATAKNWGMTGATCYNILNGFPGSNPPVNDDVITQDILAGKTAMDSLNYMGLSLKDVFVGMMLEDEVECANLTTGQQNLLRRYCQLYAVNDPNRQAYINHCYPPWYDLDEGHPTASTGCTIDYNHWRIQNDVNEAQRLGYPSFTAVAQFSRIADWMNRNCANVNYYGFGPCTMAQLSWLASRTTYQDSYDEMMMPYLYGADGVMVWIYNMGANSSYYCYSMVDANGNDNDLKRQAYGDAARAIRASQDWPTVGLYRYVGRRLPVMPLFDRRKYPAGAITLATTYSGTAPIQQIVYGMSTTGGASWTSQTLAAGTNATFTLTAGTTVILRAQSVDTLGRKSIWAANMIYVVDPAQLQCGDYESALVPGDINKDCRVDFLDCAVLGQKWMLCDDPAQAQCGAWDIQHQFYCGQTGSGHPGMAADLNGDCVITTKDFAVIANNWLKCDQPIASNCP